MAFSVEVICRACMENFSGNSMALINKKKKRKTSICKNYEELTGSKVNILASSGEFQINLISIKF
jgi:hypothetical protein